MPSSLNEVQGNQLTNSCWLTGKTHREARWSSITCTQQLSSGKVISLWTDASAAEWKWKKRGSHFYLKSQSKDKFVGCESVKEELNSINSRTKPIFISRGRQLKATVHGSDNDTSENQIHSTILPSSQFTCSVILCGTKHLPHTWDTQLLRKNILSLIKTQVNRMERWLPCTVIQVHRKY